MEAMHMGIIRDNVKKNLGYYLSLKGITQKELAKKLNVSQSAVTNWIKGKNSPDIELVAEICDILDISVTELFGVNTNEPEAELSTDQYTETERQIILQYRQKPELHQAIHILLDIK